VWDARSLTLVATLNGHQNQVNSLLYLNDNTSRLVSSSNDGTIRVWNTSNGGALLATLRVDSTQAIGASALELLSDGTLASGSSWQFMQFWNLTTYTLIKKLNTIIAFKSLFNLKSLWNGNVASSFYDGTILIWNVTACTQVVLQTGSSNSWNYAPLDELSDGTLVSGYLNIIQVWDSTSGALYNSVNLQFSPTSVKTLPNGNVAVAGWSSVLQIWQIGKNSSRLLYTLDQLIMNEYSAAYALALYDQQTFVVGYQSGLIALITENSLNKTMGFKNLKNLNSLAVASKILEIKFIYL
jgi:WD40 repeat protein